MPTSKRRGVHSIRLEWQQTKKSTLTLATAKDRMHVIGGDLMRCPACQGFASADLMNLAMHMMAKSDKRHTDWLKQFGLQEVMNGKGDRLSCRSLAEILKKIAWGEDSSSATREGVRDAVNFCSKCGCKLDATMVYCPQCGRRL